MKHTRNSSIELLRLICMFSIVLHHFIISVISPDFEDRYWTFLDLILHTSVILFVLISGFFGINFKLIKFLKTIAIVLFWSVSLSIVGRFILGKGDTIQFLNSFLPISGTNYWFVSVYLELYLVAPFINIIIENVNKRRLLYFILLLVFFVSYLGLVRHDPFFATGRNLTNFVLIYTIGRYLKKYGSFKARYNYVGVFLIICILAIICALPNINNLYIHGVAFAYQYNSPLNILLSVFFFNIVRSYEFSNNYINRLAVSAFSIYLIHEHPIMREFFYITPLEQLVIPLGGGVLAIVFAVVLSISCVLIDQPRLMLFTIITSLYEKIQKK